MIAHDLRRACALVFASYVVTGCASAKPPDARPDLPSTEFGDPTELIKTPPGCWYQKHEGTHPVTEVGELSQCLDIAIAGDAVFTIAYSDFLGPAGAYYIGGLAGATLVEDGDGLALEIGPHRRRLVRDGDRYVDDAGA